MTTATTTRPPATPMAVARTAPRRRSIMQGALAELLIVAGALTAGYVVLRMGTTHDFIAVSRQIDAFAEINANDLVVVRVNEAVGLKPVPVSDLSKIVGMYAKMQLVPGTLLSMDQLTAEPIPAPGFQLVGMSLDEGHLPGGRLSVGANVLLVVIPLKASVANPDRGADDLVPPRTIVATVVDVTPSTKQGETLVNVQVATADAPTVATLSADDRIVLALTGA
jgi:hypothetical protein